MSDLSAWSGETVSKQDLAERGFDVGGIIDAVLGTAVSKVSCFNGLPHANPRKSVETQVAKAIAPVPQARPAASLEL